MFTRKDGSKIADPWDIVDDHKHQNSVKCKKAGVVREFVIYGSKYNPNVSKICKTSIHYHRKEGKRSKLGEFKDEWYWNGQLLRITNGYDYTPAEIVCSIIENSDKDKALKRVMNKETFPSSVLYVSTTWDF